MKKTYSILVAIWVIANLGVFLLPSIIGPFQIDRINMETVTHWTGVINPFVAVIIGIIGLITLVQKNKEQT